MKLSDQAMQRIASNFKGRVAQSDDPGGQPDSRGSYYKSIKSLAEDIKEEFEKYGTDVDELVHQDVDGSAWIIYYHNNLKVLEFSDNSDAIDDVGADIDTSQGWRQIMTQVAYYAMVADLQEELSALGWNGENFGETGELEEALED